MKDNGPKKLNEIPKKDIFNVPDGYFDSLPSRIEQKLDDKSGGRIVPMNNRVWKFIGYAAAASVVLIAIVWFSLSTPDTNPSTEQLLASVSTEDLVIFLEGEDLDVKEIVDFVPGVMEEDEVDFLPFDLDEQDIQLLYEEFKTDSGETKN
jgi:hypothetical protein